MKRLSGSKAFLQLHSHLITRALRSTIESDLAAADAWSFCEFSSSLPRPPTDSIEELSPSHSKYIGDEELERVAMMEL